MRTPSSRLEVPRPQAGVGEAFGAERAHWLPEDSVGKPGVSTSTRQVQGLTHWEPLEGSHFCTTDMPDAMMKILESLTENRRSYNTENFRVREGLGFARGPAPQCTTGGLSPGNAFLGTSRQGLT